MKKKTRKTKRTRQTRRCSASNQMYKTVNAGMKATVGVAALGITATALTNIAKP